MFFRRSTPDSVSEKRPAQRLTLLPRHLSLAYAALIIYVSLHPFSGWRDPGLPVYFFLDSSWPRYWTLFDLISNIVAYVPLGFLTALSLRRRPGNWLAALTAFLLGALLSFAMECLQTWLPSRVPSSLDLGCNTLGAAIGAVLMLWHGERFFLRIVRIQQQLLAPVPNVEFGLVLAGLWLLTQLSPETLLFGAGDLRHLFEISPAVPYAAPSFFAIETAIIVSNTVAIGLLVRTLIAKSRVAPFVLIAFFAVALMTRALAAAILVAPTSALAWLTPGAAIGLLFGLAALSLILLMPALWRIVFAVLAIMAGTVLVNLAPANPYSEAALATWQQGHFLNFNGLTRLAASFWPFLALPYLTLLARRL